MKIYLVHYLTDKRYVIASSVIEAVRAWEKKEHKSASNVKSVEFVGELFAMELGNAKA